LAFRAQRGRPPAHTRKIYREHPLPPIRRNLTIVDRGEGTHLSDFWYALIQPLIYQLREAFRVYILPGTYIVIDEVMAKVKGRSHDITILLNKPIPEVSRCGYAPIMGMCMRSNYTPGSPPRSARATLDL
jgi:hypothetical protein